MGDKMKYIIPIIILSFVLLSCSKDEDEETQTAAEKAAEKAAAAQLAELEGTWKTACYTNSDNSTNLDTFIFAGNVLTIKEQEYSDTACATVYSLDEIPLTISIGDAVTFANGKTGHKFALTLGSTLKITPQSDSAVSAFNTSPFKCGFSGWVKDTARDCDIDDDEAGKTFYGIYQLDGNTWNPKCCEDKEEEVEEEVITSDTGNTFTKQ